MAARQGAASHGSVTLRDVEEADLKAFFEHQLEPVASEMAAFGPRDRDAFMAHWMTLLANATVLNKTIIVDDAVAGYVVSFDGEDHREIGYWVGRAFWGRGVATRAVATFLAHERARPLFAYVATSNAASIRVLEKCGFHRVESDQAGGAAGAERSPHPMVVLALDGR